MTDENSWIDDVIQKHRKELKDLQKSKNSFIEDSPNINYSQKFQTLNVNIMIVIILIHKVGVLKIIKRFFQVDMKIINFF